MWFIKSFIIMLLATQVVNCTNETSTAKEEKQPDDNITSTETSTTIKDDLERADSNSESTEETTLDTIIATNETIVNTRQYSWSSDEETSEDSLQVESAEQDSSTEQGSGSVVNDGNSTDSLISTISQITTTDDTSSFIEVEEQIARQVYNEDDKDESQIGKLSGNANDTAKNESTEATEPVTSSGDDLNDSDIDVSRSDHTDLVDSADDISSNDEHKEEPVTLSSTTVGDIIELFKSDTADLINKSPNSRRMLNSPPLGLDFKITAEPVTLAPQAVPSSHTEKIGQQLSNNMGARMPRIRFVTETTTFTPPTVTSPAPYPFYDNLNQSPRFNHVHSYLNKPNPLEHGFLTKHQDRFESPSSEVPLFRTWHRQPTKPSLLRQIQPYLSALASTQRPMLYHHTGQGDIIERLQQATRALRLDLAKQYADWYRSTWNPVLNNVNNNYIRRF